MSYFERTSNSVTNKLLHLGTSHSERFKRQIQARPAGCASLELSPQPQLLLRPDFLLHDRQRKELHLHLDADVALRSLIKVGDVPMTERLYIETCAQHAFDMRSL